MYDFLNKLLINKYPVHLYNLILNLSNNKAYDSKFASKLSQMGVAASKKLQFNTRYYVMEMKMTFLCIKCCLNLNEDCSCYNQNRISCMFT